jgi:hypothetical protein
MCRQCTNAARAAEFMSTGWRRSDRSGYPEALGGQGVNRMPASSGEGRLIDREHPHICQLYGSGRIIWL